MIIATTIPFTLTQLHQLQEQFDVYIKTVIDIEKKLCVAGMDRHFEGEKILLDSGSNQSNLWGGGFDPSHLIIDYNSFINIRPHDNNPSNEILNSKIRQDYESLTKYFFKAIYG